MADFDGDKLCPGSQELGNGRQDTQLKGCCMEEKGEGREIVLAAALCDGLEEPVTDSESPPRLVLRQDCGARTLIGVLSD